MQAFLGAGVEEASDEHFRIVSFLWKYIWKDGSLIRMPCIYQCGARIASSPACRVRPQRPGTWHGARVMEKQKAFGFVPDTFKAHFRTHTRIVVETGLCCWLYAKV